jgi:transglutaminase-like putative cysteine protease
MTDTAARPVSVRSVLDRPDPRDTDPDVPSRWVVLLAAAPLVVASLAFRPLVQGIGWWVSAVVVVAIVVAVMLAVRKQSRGVRFVALVAALVGTSCAAAVANGIEPLGWLDRNGALGHTLAAIKLNPAPLPETPEIRLEVTIAIAWIAGVSLFLAVVARVAALSAAPALVVLVVPGIVTGTPATTPEVVTTAVAFLAVLWVSVRPVQRALPAMLVAAIAVVVAVALPSIVPINSSWLSGVTGAIQAPIQPGRPGTLLKLGQDLREPQQLEVFRYRTSSGEPEYLKLADLDDFGTGDWVPTAVDASQAPTADQSQLAIGVNPRLATRGDVAIRITGLSSQYLPLPSGAVSVQSESTQLQLGQWRWMGDSNTIRSTGPTTRRGVTYEAYGASTFASPFLDAIAQRGRLNSLDSNAWTEPPKSELRTDLQLPANLPKIIRTDAEKVAGKAGNDYEQARALESWFTSDRFTYSETAPVEEGYDGDSMDVVAKFLRVREGYCVHFSSAMAVMARVLGIPSRIAVGYRPGGTDKDGEYAVSNRQLHSWPELYIKGAGWVGFEPTPASDLAANPGAQASTSPSTAASSTPLAPPQASASATATPTASTSSGAQALGGSGSSSSGGPLLLGLVVLVVLALAASPGVFRAVRRRRRVGAIAAARAPAFTAWREVLDDVADHGYAPGLAPPEDAAAAARTTRAVFGRLAATVPPSVLPHLATIVDAVDRERYAPPGSEYDVRVLLQAVLEARVALDASVGLPQVVRSRLLPASLAPSSAWSAAPRRTA